MSSMKDLDEVSDAVCMRCGKKASEHCSFCESACRQVEDPERRNPCLVHKTAWATGSCSGYCPPATADAASSPPQFGLNRTRLDPDLSDAHVDRVARQLFRAFDDVNIGREPLHDFDTMVECGCGEHWHALAREAIRLGAVVSAVEDI